LTTADFTNGLPSYKATNIYYDSYTAALVIVPPQIRNSIASHRITATAGTDKP